MVAALDELGAKAQKRESGRFVFGQDVRLEDLLAAQDLKPFAQATETQESENAVTSVSNCK